MAKVIIFGTGDIAQLAHFYLTYDSDHDVVAFTVDKEYLKEKTYCGLPVIDFSEINTKYPPTDFKMFIALSYTKLNAIRKTKYLKAKDKGYSLISYVSTRSTFFNNVRWGENCFILENNVLQPFVTIGNNVTLWSGNHIGHHSTVGDHCFISSHVVIAGGVKVGPACFLGVNSTIRDHVTLGEKCVIGAGALILDNVSSDGIYLGHSSSRSKLPSSKLRGI